MDLMTKYEPKLRNGFEVVSILTVGERGPRGRGLYVTFRNENGMFDSRHVHDTGRMCKKRIDGYDLLPILPTVHKGTRWIFFYVECGYSDVESATYETIEQAEEARNILLESSASCSNIEPISQEWTA